MSAFVFDLDGTLLDTLFDIASACNAMLARNGYPQHPSLAYTQMVGNGFANLVKAALPQDRMPDACALEKLTAEARSYYAGHLVQQTRPYPGVCSALAALENQGAKLGVLSNKPDPQTKELIGYFFPEINFVFVQGAVPGAPLKPDPAILLELLNKHAIDRGVCAYVGDSNVDMQTAKAAGLYALGAAWGFRGAEELRLAGADKIIASAQELVGLTIPTK